MSCKEPYLMALCDEKGIITVNNVFTGTVLFRLSKERIELNSMKFANCNT